MFIDRAQKDTHVERVGDSAGDQLLGTLLLHSAAARSPEAFRSSTHMQYRLDGLQPRRPQPLESASGHGEHQLAEPTDSLRR